LKKGLNLLGILLKSTKMRDHTFLEINWAADHLATNPVILHIVPHQLIWIQLRRLWWTLEYSELPAPGLNSSTRILFQELLGSEPPSLRSRQRWTL
jgi:hypothetical protein